MISTFRKSAQSISSGDRKGSKSATDGNRKENQGGWTVMSATVSLIAQLNIPEKYPGSRPLFP